MLDGEERRQEILKSLKNTPQAIPARRFAEIFKVSRQVIVGDIALLRAEGHPIISSYKGYHLEEELQGYIAQYVAKHTKKDTQKELETIVEMGAIVRDVTIEHPFYGELTGRLEIQTYEDIHTFLKQQPELLAGLTHGIHTHTLICKDKEHFIHVLKKLDELGFVYKN